MDRVIVRAHEVEIKLKLGALISEAATHSHASAGAWKSFDWDTLIHTIILPVQLKRTGLAVKLIIAAPEHRIKRVANPKMVRLLCKAHDWFGQLTSGKVKSMKEIGDAEGLHRTYIHRVVQLAFLAPDITKSILMGKQPEMLGADKLLRSVPIPIDWKEQRKVFGFD